MQSLAHNGPWCDTFENNGIDLWSPGFKECTCLSRGISQYKVDLAVSDEHSFQFCVIPWPKCICHTELVLWLGAAEIGGHNYSSTHSQKTRAARWDSVNAQHHFFFVSWIRFYHPHIYTWPEASREMCLAWNEPVFLMGPHGHDACLWIHFGLSEALLLGCLPSPCWVNINSRTFLDV